MSEIKVDTVAEKTSANGVTIDGLNIKDSKLVTANSVVTSNITDGAISAAKLASGVGGKILQVVTNTHATRFSTTSTSFVAATGYTVAITPSATSSKVFVIVSSMQDIGASGRVAYSTLFRNTTNLANGLGIAASHSDSGRLYTPVTLSVLDSPSSTSAVTYQVYFRTNGGAVVFNDTEGEAQLTAFEIAG